MSFKARPVLPGVFHIEDAMGVCMTLLTGAKEALLIDAGYGLEPVRAYIRTLTPLPCRLLLTHGHHDHALGAMGFERVLLHPDDRATYDTYTAAEQRQRVLADAARKGIRVDAAAYLAARMPSPDWIREGCFDLGGLTAQVIHCPGHTPGSLLVYVPERGLLLTGDNWNPTPWLFFPEALPVTDYLRNMRAVLAAYAFTHVLCPHSGVMHERAELETFLSGLTREHLETASLCEEGASRGIRTGRCVPAPGQQLIFDLDK